jgi:hypothetical protein
MNHLSDNSSDTLQDFFFRTADRMRVEGCANAIANEGLSLVLYSPVEPLLDHYLGLLLERLRRHAPEPRIEVYFPTSTDTLLARFNDVLAKQSVKEATRQPQETNSPQIWIVHDTQQLPDQEIQLMARLIQNFPGANIRAILLMTGSNPQKASLAALGRKVLRWDIEAPSPEQAKLALENAAQNGQLQAATQLLRRMGRMPEPLLEINPDSAEKYEKNPIQSDQQRPLGNLSRWMQSWRQAPSRWAQALSPRASGVTAQMQGGSKSPPRLRMTLAILGGLLFSVAVMAWLQPQAFGIGSRRPQAVSAPTTPPTEPASSAVSAQVVPPVAATAAASEPAPEVPDESQQSQTWVRSLPVDSFLIQHGNVTTYEKALVLKKGVPTPANAKIVAAFRPGESLAHFVIVSGPFETLGKAYESIKRREATKNSWVRATKTLQDQINGPKRPQEVRP